MVIMSKKFFQIKFGFSLAEALVSMLVISLFFLATAKVITIKEKDKPKMLSGFYECYCSNNTCKQHGSKIAEEDLNNNMCTYKLMNEVPSLYMCVVANGNAVCTLDAVPMQLNLENEADRVLSYNIQSIAALPNESDFSTWNWPQADPENPENRNTSITALCSSIKKSFSQTQLASACQDSDDGLSYVLPNDFSEWLIYW